MKAVQFLILYFMSLLLFIACSNNDDEASEDNSFPPYHYTYCLSFSDVEGNDLLQGIETELDDTGKPVLKLGTYSYEVVKSGNSGEEFFPLPPLSLWNGEKVRFLHIQVTAKDEPDYQTPEVVTVKLVNRYIFGDNKEHVLVSYWKFEDGNPNSEAVLTRVTIDGTDASILEHKKYDTYVFATLTK